MPWALSAAITFRIVDEAAANAPEALRSKMGQNAERAKALAAMMTNGRAEVVPNTGHLVFLEAPAKYSELLLGFLAVAP